MFTSASEGSRERAGAGAARVFWRRDSRRDLFPMFPHQSCTGCIHDMGVLLGEPEYTLVVGGSAETPTLALILSSLEIYPVMWCGTL